MKTQAAEKEPLNREDFVDINLKKPNPPDPAPLPFPPIGPTNIEGNDPVIDPAATDVGEIETQGMGSGGGSILETKLVPNGRRLDLAEPPEFRLTYRSLIFGSPNRWPLFTPA
jgi:hypothetical protein